MKTDKMKLVWILIFRREKLATRKEVISTKMRLGYFWGEGEAVIGKYGRKVLLDLGDGYSCVFLKKKMYPFVLYAFLCVTIHKKKVKYIKC